FAADLGADAPLICYQGALVQDPTNGAVLLHRTVPRDLAAEVITLARAHDWQCNLYIADHVYVERLKPEAGIYFGLNPVVPPERVPDLAALVAAAPAAPTKLVLVRPTERETDATLAALHSRFDGALYLTKSH